jgi:hypothetical protein
LERFCKVLQGLVRFGKVWYGLVGCDKVLERYGKVLESFGKVWYVGLDRLIQNICLYHEFYRIRNILVRASLFRRFSRTGQCSGH